MSRPSISTQAIEAAAPDQESLKAAGKLLSASKWPERLVSPDGAFIWGACQGSGANPYRVAVDLSDLGAKCSCPSRKFPCKHALALMIQWSGSQADFAEAPVADWITEWLGRRRKSDASAASTVGKSLAAAQAPEVEKPVDPKDEAKKEAARQKRAEATTQSVSAGLTELETWILDQLRTGLGETLADVTTRCRRIAARLVDAKAAALAARIDMIPARVLGLPQKDRSEALSAELGKLVILSRAWNGGNCAAEVRRDIIAAEPREALLVDETAPRHSGVWEIIATREETRRDGLIARSTWLLGLDPAGPRFALLQDFFPAATGRQGSAFALGEQFEGELVFYPARHPMRAHIADRRPVGVQAAWPEGVAHALSSYARQIAEQPWLQDLPVLLPAGQLAMAGEALWWQGHSGEALPLIADRVSAIVRGTNLLACVVLWNAFSADLLAANTDLGLYHAAG